MVRFENVGLRYGLGPEVLRDLTFRSGGFTLYLPIATGIILSILLTVALNFLFRQR